MQIKKVVCPFQPKNFLRIEQLQNHIKVCPKRVQLQKKKQQLWYSKDKYIHNKNLQPQFNINFKNPQQHNIKQTIHLLIILPKIFYNLLCKNQLKLAKYFLYSHSNNQFIIKNNIDKLQTNQIVRELKDVDLLGNQYIYLQFGAGKGILSHTVSQNLKDPKVILFERQPRRNKYDKYWRKNPFFLRFKTDIKDFNFSNIKSIIKEKINQDHWYKLEQQLYTVGICKHMCGNGIDLAIMALTGQLCYPLKGSVMATCCHHLCDINSYCNISFLQQLGLNKQKICLFFKMTSWGVSSKIENQQLIREIIQNKKEIVINELRNQEKVIYGKMAKRIIDLGRVQYMRNVTKLRVDLRKYCQQELSPQNFAIVSYE